MKSDKKSYNEERQDFWSELGLEIPKEEIKPVPQGHTERFAQKLEQSQKPKSGKKIRLWTILSAVACVALFFGITQFLDLETSDEKPQLSESTQASEMYFNQVINNELAKLKEKSDPVTQLVIQDAIKQLDLMENDYQKLRKQMIENGENKQLIKAMIVNFQQRINFLNDILKRTEEINKMNQQKGNI